MRRHEGMKRGGAGKGNWGTVEDDQEDVAAAETPEPAEGEEARDDSGNGQEYEAPKPAEPEEV